MSFAFPSYGVGSAGEAGHEIVPPDWFHGLEIGGEVGGEALSEGLVLKATKTVQ